MLVWITLVICHIAFFTLAMFFFIFTKRLYHNFFINAIKSLLFLNLCRISFLINCTRYIDNRMTITITIMYIRLKNNSVITVLKALNIINKTSDITVISSHLFSNIIVHHIIYIVNKYINYLMYNINSIIFIVNF